MKSRKKSNKFSILYINFVSSTVVICLKLFISDGEILLFYLILVLLKKIVLKIFKRL